jgi:hypothetical protein
LLLAICSFAEASTFSDVTPDPLSRSLSGADACQSCRQSRRRSQPITKTSLPVPIGLAFPQSRGALAQTTHACGRGIARAVQGRHRLAQHQAVRLWSWKRPCCLTRERGDSSSLMGDNSAASPATSDSVLPTFVVRAFPNARDYGRC